MRSYTTFYRLLAVLVGSLFAVSAIADDESDPRSFKGPLMIKGVLMGNANWSLDAGCPDGLRTFGTAEGEMSALGMVVFENDHCTAMIADGGGRLITESGEEIWISYLLPTISMMPPMEPFWPEPRIVMQGSGLVIGGTGRFLKAHGTVEITAFPIPVNPGGPGLEWPVEVALSGSLMSGPGKH